MARKPKTQPSPDATAAVPAPEPAAPDEAAAPARRGHKAKAAALSFASPPASDFGSPAPDDAGAGLPKAGLTKAPGRKGQGRKPRQAAGGEAAPSIQDGATGPRDQAPREPKAGTSPDLGGDDVPMAAAASRAETAADRDPVSPAGEAAQSVPETGASTPAEPAARWDRTTDRVQFDWPAIERTAARGGPNQAMAKLLAEGARSRWPF